MRLILPDSKNRGPSQEDPNTLPSHIQRHHSLGNVSLMFILTSMTSMCNLSKRESQYCRLESIGKNRLRRSLNQNRVSLHKRSKKMILKKLRNQNNNTLKATYRKIERLFSHTFETFSFQMAPLRRSVATMITRATSQSTRPTSNQKN